MSARQVRRRWAAVAVAAVALATALAGCSLSAAHPAPGTGGASATSGASTRVGSSVAAKVARADRTQEVPTPAPGQRVAGGWQRPAEAVYVFATQYINWNSQDVSARLRALARVCVGQARAAVTEAATGTASDYELKQGGLANAGMVEAIAPVVGQPHEYAVVTRERTTATGSDAYQGLAPAWHLALATVTRLKSGLWVLSDWQPES